MSSDLTHPHPAEVGEDLAVVIDRLRPRLSDIQARWNAATPFRYVVIDDFLPAEMVEAMDAVYPVPDIEGWDKITYTHQRKKFTMRGGFPAPIQRFFDLLAAPEFRAFLTDVTGIPKLLDDPELVGGGLHQILRGGFLDVHVDYNFHPTTKLHRRLNLLLYVNRDWRPEYEGYLELWDRGAQTRQLEAIAPMFNRAVMFETNERSFHGHPKPLATPPDKTRRSLAVYYYTAERDQVASEHNTIYYQSTGVQGYLKTTLASVQATAERLRAKGLGFLVRDIREKVRRRLRGLPPENR